MQQLFYAEPRSAKEVVGSASTTNLPEDLKERYAEYAGSGHGDMAVSFHLDDKILLATATTLACGVRQHLLPQTRSCTLRRWRAMLRSRRHCCSHRPQLASH